MVAIVPQEWVAGSTYAANDRVVYNGVSYAARSALGSSDTTAPSQDDTNWAFDGLINVQDLTGVCRAVKQHARIDTDSINRSIPHYVQKAQADLDSVLRSPVQRDTHILTSDDQGRIRVDNLGIIELRHLRINDTISSTYNGFMTRGQTEIKVASEDQYQEIINYYAGNTNDFWGWIDQKYSGPVYTFDGTYLYIAPMYDTGTEFEIKIFSKPLTLGTRAVVTNAAGDPINSAGQTEEQWVAGGGTAATFVERMDVVEENLYTTDLFVDALIAKTIVNMQSVLNDTEQAIFWQGQYTAALNRLDKLLNDFTAKQEQEITQESPYLSGR